MRARAAWAEAAKAHKTRAASVFMRRIVSICRPAGSTLKSGTAKVS
jgi:hypothetical protein